MEISEVTCIYRRKWSFLKWCERERETFEFLEEEVMTIVTFEPFQWNTRTIVRSLCLSTTQSIFVRIRNKIDAFQRIWEHFMKFFKKFRLGEMPHYHKYSRVYHSTTSLPFLTINVLGRALRKIFFLLSLFLLLFVLILFKFVNFGNNFRWWNECCKFTSLK